MADVMTRPFWLLRSDDLFWSPTGWTHRREWAERYESREQARIAAWLLDTDRDCVAVKCVGRQRPEVSR